jgi:hypothetical protein
MNAAPAVVRRYDVMPDGSGLLGFATGNTGDGSRTIDIVYNWFGEIKRKVPVH